MGLAHSGLLKVPEDDVIINLRAVRDMQGDDILFAL